MKKIKDLTIKVTYRVGLSDVEVPDKVYDELAKAYDEGGYVPEGDDELENANEWLLDNIRQEDAMDGSLRLTIFKMNNSKLISNEKCNENSQEVSRT